MNYNKFPTYEIGPFQIDWLHALDHLPDNGVKVLYSPSTHRIICPINFDLTGTILLNTLFQPKSILYAAPIEMDEMSDSWSNQDIDDWEERNIRVWKDLAD